MSNAYGEHFKVNEEPLHIYIDSTTYQGEQHGYDEHGNWVQLIGNTNVVELLADKYADGEIAIGGNIDHIMQELSDTYQRIDQIVANNKTIADEKKRKEEEEHPAKEARKKAELEERNKKDDEEKAKAEADKAKQAEEAELRQKEMLAWAQEHGSERLRKGLEQGYTCIKLYETELGEFLIADSDYEYDRDDKVEVKGRSCPSLDALNEAERINQIEGLSGEVKWLPEGLSELHKDPDPDEYFEAEGGCEAVFVDVKATSGYWYKKI
jgi:hypothetical protein